MNKKYSIARTIVLFVALTIAGISVAASSRFVTSASDQTIMITVGSAIFGAALTFFMIRLFSLMDK
jgi:hypothetical protein